LRTKQHHEKWEWTQVLRTGKQFLPHSWHPLCYNHGDKLWNTRFVSQVIVASTKLSKLWLPLNH
jgi:hypothetical protein